ncbi:uncharacterized protein [Hyperolius riggenbachi]
MCFSKWHCPPEQVEEQPLYKEINSAIKGAFSNMKMKARPLEEYEILIALANGLIAHLKNFRKKRVSYKYNTEQEEVDFLRRQTRSLLAYWLPDSLKESNHILVFLNEIISVNVLKPAIRNLADSTFINETIVRNLRSSEIRQEKGCFDVCDGHMDPASSMEVQECAALMESDGVITREYERESSFRSYPDPAKFFTDNNLCDGPVDESSDDDDDDDIPLSLIDSVLQKWMEENLTATICESPTENRHTYRIRVFKEDTKLWITERSVEEFKCFYDTIYEKHQDYIVSHELQKTEAETEGDSQFFETINTTPEKFLDTLLGLIKDHQDPEAVFFLSPFKYKDDERELFHKTFSDSDEEVSTEDSGTEEQSGEDSQGDTNDFLESDGFRSFIPKKKKKEKNKDNSNLDVTPDRRAEAHTVRQSEAVAFSAVSFRSPIHEPRAKHKHDYRTEELPNYKLDKEMNKRRKKLETALVDALCRLVDEIFAGGKSIVPFLRHVGLLETWIKRVLDDLPKLYTEEQIEYYLTQASVLLLSDVDPLPLSPQQLKSEAQKLLKNQLESVLMNKVIKYLLEKGILKNITMSHEAFQNSRANKETLYGLLEDLTRIITNVSLELSGK